MAATGPWLVAIGGSNSISWTRALAQRTQNRGGSAIREIRYPIAGSVDTWIRVFPGSDGLVVGGAPSAANSD
uniref:Putative secreted protein n=1 Tax=Anopheles darlingi TaxID=43151 RepID=A0A2M4D771_ANODA